MATSVRSNARNELVWGTFKDKRGIKREGYVRQHLADVVATVASRITSHSQITSLPRIRSDLPHIGRWSATAQQQIMRKVEKTFSAFFGRIRRGEKAGFPRFKARDRYHAADFRVGDGITLRKSSKLRFVGVPGEIKVRWHRELPSEPASAILTRQGGKWYIVFHVEVVTAERSSPDCVGIDLGLTSFAALSTGESIARQRITKTNERKLRRLQRALSRSRKRSRTWRKRKAAVTAHQAYIANVRRDFLHKQSRALANRFGRIGVEALNIKGLARGMLAKDVHDASWGTFISMLRYKAANAGGDLIEIDPRGTSQTCPECGTVKAKTLAEREHRCDCGCVLDRDVAAAMVVHFRAFGYSPGIGDGSLIGRVSAKIELGAAQL